MIRCVDGQFVFVDIQSFADDRNRAVLDFFDTQGLKPLTPEQKLKAFSDPMIMSNAVYLSSSLLANCGYWPINESPLVDYGFPEGSFHQKLREIRDRTGKEHLKVGDFGGGRGCALNTMKLLDSDLETYNFVMDESLGMWPADHLVLGQIEQMGESLFEQLDLVVSKDAFRHFAFPDVALRNLLLSLSVGGEAYIGFSTHSNMAISQNALGERFKAFLEWAKPHVDAGVISWDLPEPFANNPHGMVYGPQMVRIVKHDHITRRTNRSGNDRLRMFLERVLSDAENERFPIDTRSRDCERFNYFAIQLNARHMAGDVEGVRKEIANIVRVLASLEE